jgi:hypothetical protein
MLEHYLCSSVLTHFQQISSLSYRTLTCQGVGVRSSNLYDGIKLFEIRLRALELTNKHVSLVASFRTDIVEEELLISLRSVQKGNQLIRPGSPP